MQPNRAPAYWTVDFGPVIFGGGGKFTYVEEILAMIRLAEAGNAQALRDVTEEIENAETRGETPDPRLINFCTQLPKRFADREIKLQKGTRGKPADPKIYDRNLDLALEVRRRILFGNEPELEAIPNTAERNKIDERTVKEAYQLHRQDVKKIIPDEPR